MSSADSTQSTISDNTQSQPSGESRLGPTSPANQTSHPVPTEYQSQQRNGDQQSEAVGRQSDSTERADETSGESLEDRTHAVIGKTEDASQSEEAGPVVDVQEQVSVEATKSKPVKESTETPPVHLLDAQPDWNEKQDYGEQRSSGTIPNPEHDFDDKQKEGETTEARPEIESIVQQFTGEKGQAKKVVSSPQRSELPIFSYPPRSSSLEHPAPGSSSQASPAADQNEASARPPHRASDSVSLSSQAAPALPEPDPEPTLPFDFHRFLEQLRHRTADPVAKFLRSFLLEFSKKQWQVHEQVKIISDFLTFIAGKMMQCDIWRHVSDAEFDNAKEGMEKLVMNRLYAQTFSPEIPPLDTSPMKARRKDTSGPGRKGQHQEDVERDEVLAQKVRIYGWIREEHLDMQPFGDKGRKFLNLAQQELQKIKAYRAPRDKVICVLNTCKVLFGFLKSAHNKDQSADAFIPLLIWTVLKANPDHLVSNVQYITRFRSQEKLTGEAGYYMSSLMGAVQFIENLDRTNLTITDAEFEANVEAAVSSFQEQHRQDQTEKTRPSLAPSQPSAHPTFNEKASIAHPEVTPRHSLEGERSSTRRMPLRTTDPSSGSEGEDENAAVAGLLRTIQKPLSTIGRIFSDDGSSQTTSAQNRPPMTPQPGSSPRPPRGSSMQPQPKLSNGLPPLPGPQTRPGSLPPQQQLPGAGNTAPGVLAAANRTRLTAEDSAARQASAEAAQAQQVTQAEHRTVVETLAGMFPGLDKDIISDVVRQKQGRVGLAVDACLALSR